jgi:hypothetical protein
MSWAKKAQLISLFLENQLNRVSVNKIFLVQPSPESKVEVMIPICEVVFILIKSKVSYLVSLI